MYFERSIADNSPISSFPHLSRTLISRYLDLCQGFTGELSPHSLAHQCLRTDQAGSPSSPRFPDSHVTSICVYRTYGTGETFPENIQTCEPASRSVSRSFPDQHHAFWARAVSRSTAGRALPRFIRERQHRPGRVSGCHSGAHGIPGHLIFHERHQATLTNRVTMCRTVKRLFHVYSKAPHGSAYSSL